MISIAKVIQLHDQLIDRDGGSKGVRDSGGLEAALARPFATFDQQDLYPSAFDKAAAVFESLIINHPFIDGNKRIAYVAMHVLLNLSGIKIQATEDEQYNFVISASTGSIGFDEIKSWLAANSVKI